MKPWQVVRRGSRRPLESMLTFAGCANPVMWCISAIVFSHVSDFLIFSRMAAVLATATSAGLAWGWFMWRWWSSAPAPISGEAVDLQPFEFTLDFQTCYPMAAELLWRTPGHAFAMTAFPTICMIGLSLLIHPFYGWLWLDDIWWLHTIISTAFYVLGFALAVPLYTTNLALRRLKQRGAKFSIRLSTRGVEGVDWSRITSVRGTVNAIYFLRDIFPLNVVPVRNLLSEKQIDTIRKLATDHMGRP